MNESTQLVPLNPSTTSSLLHLYLSSCFATVYRRDDFIARPTLVMALVKSKSWPPIKYAFILKLRARKKAKIYKEGGVVVVVETDTPCTGVSRRLFTKFKGPCRITKMNDRGPGYYERKL
nr:unnamed protein product [Callosobruchus chinensis]